MEIGNTENLRKHFNRHHLLPNIFSGVVVGLVSIGLNISYALAIFSFPGLDQYLEEGIKATLFTCWFVMFFYAIFSSSPTSIAGPTPKIIAILAVIASTVSSQLSDAGMSGEIIYLYVMSVLGVTSIITGAILVLLGRQNWGAILGYIPYPVVAGFMASTGFILLVNSARLLTGMSQDGGIFSLPLYVLAPVFCSVLILQLVKKYIKSYYAIPLVILVGTVTFYGTLFYSGLSVSDARQDGLLLSKMSGMDSLNVTTPFTTPGLLDLMSEQWHNLLALLAIIIFSTLFTVAGVELCTDSDIDLNLELKVTGLSNIFSGLLGGMSGSISSTRTMLNIESGANSRIAGITAGLFVLIMTSLFAPLITFLPTPVLVGILLSLSISMIKTWLWSTFEKMPRQEYIIAVAIVGVSVWLGLLAGIMFGFLFTLIHSVFYYSKISCISKNVTLKNERSKKERPLAHAMILRQHGHRAKILLLEGYLFWGSAQQVLHTCRTLIENETVDCIHLDFKRVRGADTSAASSMDKLIRLCNQNDVKLTFSNISKSAKILLGPLNRPQSPKCFPHVDFALEFLEENLLEEYRDSLHGSLDSENLTIQQLLSPYITKSSVDMIFEYMTPIDLEKGDVLFSPGDSGDALFFLEAGELTVSWDNKNNKRLKTFIPGSVIGAIGVYSYKPRGTVCTATRKSRVFRILSSDIEILEQIQPGAAHEFHRYIIKLLSSNFIGANDQIRELS